MGENEGISLNNLNTLVKNASYAVRGPIMGRAMNLAKQLRDGVRLPFSSIVSCNIGNPQAFGQKPISFLRDVLSVVLNPSLRDRAIFAEDVISRANRYLSSIPSIGAYTDSQGILAVRDDVANFISKRDGHVCSPCNIYLTNGASEGIRLCLQSFIRPPRAGRTQLDGILAPIPQYPLYSSLTTLFQGSLVPYALDEAHNWSLSTTMLSEAVEKARGNGIAVRALVVINPGNPTGQVLDEDTMRNVIAFCRKERICLLADEVYQENIWTDAPFVSFRKVACDMDAFAATADGNLGPLQLVSFHSNSKGFYGECGLRGGYFEALGLPGDVMGEIYKLIASVSLCSNTMGQIAVGVMCTPPLPGDASFETFHEEKTAILDSLRRRALLVSNVLNTLEGVRCTPIAGSLYAFPSIKLPVKALETAEELGMGPDDMYCVALLDSTGIVVVPGSGFGQVAGTHHFRITILPPEEQMDDVLQRLAAFHVSFMDQYRESD